MALYGGSVGQAFAEAAVERTAAWYLGAWNADDAAERWQLLLATWSEHGRFEDPLIRLSGRAAMAVHIRRCHQRYSDRRFLLRRCTSIANRGFQLEWSMVDGRGDEVLAGGNIGKLDALGRIERLVAYYQARGGERTRNTAWNQSGPRLFGGATLRHLGDDRDDDRPCPAEPPPQPLTPDSLTALALPA
jgi:hypothetical protein